MLGSKAVAALCGWSAFSAKYGSVCTTTKKSLEIVNADVSPDGFSRSAVLASGSFPGPLISGKKNGSFKINVTNHLVDDTMVRSTSVHWHGLFLKSKNWADGSAWVTQCPIAQGQSFLYDFKSDGQAGTFWYHSHLSTQFCDGLRGPLVIYDPKDPHRSLYDIDDASTIITIADWYHYPAPSLLLPGHIPPSADSTLINGKGRYLKGPKTPLSIVNVKAGKRYRFRIIAMSCDPNYVFSIDQHTLTVIEADGESTQPVKVDSLQIFAGQRYSAVLRANQPVGNYWIRAEPNLGRGPAGFEGGLNSAILRYAGAPDADPTTSQKPSKHPLREVDLHPLHNPAAPGHPFPGAADVNLNFVMGLDPETFTLTMNGAAFLPPTVPVLLQIMSGARTAQELLPPGTVYMLPKNKVIEITMPGSPLNLGAPHPFHLHGHTFSVIRSVGSSKYNYANPVRRDTVDTGFENDNVTIRFVTDNTGPWFLHCHIEWHLELGLGVILAVDTQNVANKVATPDSWKDLCPSYNSLTPEMTAARKITLPESAVPPLAGP